MGAQFCYLGCRLLEFCNIHASCKSIDYYSAIDDLVISWAALPATVSMMRRLSYLLILVCAWLLAGCKELAVPSFTEIPIPETITKPKAIITLTEVDITGTVPFTGHQIAVVWMTSVGRYVGILDTDTHVVQRLKVTLSGDYWSNGLLWPPNEKTLIYQQTSLDHGFDLLAVRADSSEYIHTIDNFHYPPACTWSPDGRYLACSSVMCHGCDRQLEVYDSTNWKSVCYTYALGWDHPCKALRLNNGELWNMQFSEMSWGGVPSSEISQEARKIALEFCRRYKGNNQQCEGIALSNEHSIPVWTNVGLLIVDVDKKQVLRIGTTPDDLSWSTDKSHLAWIEDGGVRVFDAGTHDVIAFDIPNAKILNLAWSPVQ
jgi:hypothetical protein